MENPGYGETKEADGKYILVYFPDSSSGGLKSRGLGVLWGARTCEQTFSLLYRQATSVHPRTIQVKVYSLNSLPMIYFK